LKKYSISLLVLLFSMTSFAAHFKCEPQLATPEVHLVSGYAETTNLLTSLQVDEVTIGDVQASTELKKSDGQNFLSFSFSNAVEYRLLLSPSIGQFEDHENFVGYIVIKKTNSKANIALNCKMN
jgi:hypothetical protein